MRLVRHLFPQVLSCKFKKDLKTEYRKPFPKGKGFFVRKMKKNNFTNEKKRSIISSVYAQTVRKP